MTSVCLSSLELKIIPFGGIIQTSDRNIKHIINNDIGGTISSIGAAKCRMWLLNPHRMTVLFESQRNGKLGCSCCTVYDNGWRTCASSRSSRRGVLPLTLEMNRFRGANIDSWLSEKSVPAHYVGGQIEPVKSYQYFSEAPTAFQISDVLFDENLCCQQFDIVILFTTTNRGNIMK